ncbi:hypothetical protein [Thermomonas sp.]|uniref:hypothetical protein n=1 Tax=Thermomonas sp. TaxID=1971895 RepID=UPI0024872414|nr:hypothetical protein [Thermomonas sp.]MDI1251965.1 hypothetical protein [Thermomonas sp.]
MALTLGTTGMDSSTQADVTTAFKAANAELGSHWTLVADDNADYVVVDMDSMYGPMSWLRLHAAGRKVIGLTSVERSQTDYRLMRPINASDFTVLLSEIARDAPPAQTTTAPATSTPAPAPSDHLPDARSLPEDETEASPVDSPSMVSMPAAAAELTHTPAPAPSMPVPPDRPLSSWLGGNGLERRVRLQRDDGPVLLIDPRSKIYHGPATLKPLAASFEGTLLIEDFETPDAAKWEAEAAKLGEAQPLARLQWLGGLLVGGGKLLPGNDPDGQYRLTKWPQTEREFPKHFRIATAMMKGPSTLDEIAAASGVDRAEIADFVNANLATGYAELVIPVAPEPESPAKPSGGLFGRMRGR